MMSQARWQNLWGTLTTPHAADADEARREYMTKVISLIVAIVACGVTFIFVAGWVLGFLPPDSVFITLSMTLAFGGTWWLAYCGHWRAASYIPPAVIFLTAVYGNWIGGAGAPAMVLYALAIVLTAILQGERAQWIILALSIAAYVGIGEAQFSGYIIPLRSVETAFANRVVVVVGVYISLAALLWFLINQFRRALAQTRVYANQLAAANRQLEQEIIVRQQVDESLRQSNETLQALIDYSPLAIIKLDADGQILLWNHAAEKLYGWTRAEVLGQFAPMIPPQHLSEYQDIRARLLKGETLTNLEVERQRKDGALILVNLSMSPLRDAQGTITAFMSIIVDITESYRAKAALHESEQRFRLFMQHFPGLAYIKDAATRVLFANQGFEDYLNIPPAAIVGKTNEEVFPAEFAQHITADDQQVLTSGASEVIEESYAGRTWSTHKFIIPQTDKPPLLGGFTLDITERKRTETALAQERDLLQALMDNLPDAIYFKDRASQFMRINRAQAQIMGLPTSDAAIGKTDFDFFPADLCEMYFQEEQQLMQTGLPVLDRLEFNPTPDGQPRWFAATKAAIRDTTGSIVGMVGVSRDVTDRVAVQERANTTSHGLRAVIEIAYELIGCTNLDLLCRRAVELARDKLNVERCGLFLLDDEGILHGTYGTDAQRQTTDERTTRLPPADRLEFDVASAQLWTIFESELTYREDGQRQVMGIGWIGSTLIRSRERTIGVMYNDTAISHAPVNEAQQEVLAVYCSLLGSLIELKRTEGTLRKTQFAVDLARDAIHWVDAEGRLIYVNDAICQALGYTRDELLGMTIFDIDPTFPRETWRDHWQKVSTLRSIQFEGLHQARDGHIFPVEVSVNVMAFGNEEFHCDYVRDITERKRAETERERLIAELENKNAELERFTYTASHDLKSPLVTIRGFLGFLEKDIVAGDFDQLRADIARIRNATDRMQRLLNELLELSRIGRMMNPPEAVSFAAIVHEAVELVQGRLTAQGVQIEIQPDLPVVQGDRMRLVEVVQNLVDNASKFMGDQAAPKIMIGRSGADRDGKPILFVRDNGIGIDPQYHQKVFGLFDKLDPQAEGTGIGLALVKRIVEVHGGRIWVESAGARTGSTFCFTLPVRLTT